MRFFQIFAAVVLLLNTTPASAEDQITLSARAHPDLVRPGGEFTLSVTAEGKGLSVIPDPNLPRLKKFEIVGRNVSQQMSMVNFDMTISKTITYTIKVPTETKDGLYKIPVITLNFRNKTYRTGPVEIQVDSDAPEPNAPVTRRRRGRFFDPFEYMQGFGKRNRIDVKDLRVDLHIAEKKIYLYQPVIATFRFMRAVSLYRQPSYQKPAFKGFWVEAIKYSDGSSQQVGNVTKNGRKYAVTTIKYALIPLVVGKTTIEPAVLQVEPDPFAAPIKLKTEPIEVEVESHPKEGKPLNFNGMVGDYNVSSTLTPDVLSRSKIDLGESLTLKITIEGEGYLKPVPAPVIDKTENLDMFEPKVTDSIETSSGKLISKRVIEIPLIAKKSGKVTIKPLQISWFDPVKKEYVETQTEEYDFVISGENKPAKQTSSTEPLDMNETKEDITYIRADLDRLSKEDEPPYTKPWYLLLVMLPPLATIGFYFYCSKRRKLLTDHSLLKQKKAFENFERSYKSPLATENLKKHTAGMELAFRQYFADIWDLQTGAISPELLKEKLPERLAHKAITILNRFSSVLYAPTEDSGGTKKLLAEAIELVNEVEKWR